MLHQTLDSSLFDSNSPTPANPFIGITFAICGNVLISVSLNIQKYVHNLLAFNDYMSSSQVNTNLAATQPPATARSTFASRPVDSREGGSTSRFQPSLPNKTPPKDDTSILGQSKDGRLDIREMVSPHLQVQEVARNLKLNSPVRDDSQIQSFQEQRPPLTPSRQLFINTSQNDPLSSMSHSSSHEMEGIERNQHRVDMIEIESDIDSPTGEDLRYLKQPLWWVGMIMMVAGESGNFFAYGFAPASVIAPLGTVALISNAIVAPLLLKETFRRQDAFGILLSIFGAAVVVMSSKAEEPTFTPDAIMAALIQTKFLIYLFVTTTLIVALIYLSRTIGNQYIYIDLLLVALFGAYTVLSTKAISSLLSLSVVEMLKFGMSYFLIFVLASTAILQVRYLNKALSNFDSIEVIPTQFVFFTISTIIGSAILYNDFEQVTAIKMFQFILGCVLTFLGVYYITSNRDKQASQHMPGNYEIADRGRASDYLEDTFSNILERQSHDPSRLTETLGYHKGNGGKGTSPTTPLLIQDHYYSRTGEMPNTGTPGNFAQNALHSMYSSSVPTYVQDRFHNISNASRASLSRLSSEMHHVLYTVGTRHSQSLGLAFPESPSRRSHPSMNSP